MESQTKTKKSGFLFWILIIAAIVAFFTNPTIDDYEAYEYDRVYHVTNRYNHSWHLVDTFEERIPATSTNYLFFTVFEQKHYLYNKLSSQSMKNPKYILTTKGLGLFNTIWDLDLEYRQMH